MEWREVLAIFPFLWPFLQREQGEWLVYHAALSYQMTHVYWDDPRTTLCQQAGRLMCGLQNHFLPAVQCKLVTMQPQIWAIAFIFLSDCWGSKFTVTGSNSVLTCSTSVWLCWSQWGYIRLQSVQNLVCSVWERDIYLHINRYPSVPWSHHLKYIEMIFFPISIFIIYIGNFW